MPTVLPVGRNASTCWPDASNRIVTCAGGLAWPGATSANSSFEVQRVLDESDDVAGHAVRDEGVADVHVERRRGVARSSRSSPGPVGKRPATRRSVGCPYVPFGSSARRSTVLSDPGIAMLWWSISSIVPKARCAAATSARSAPENVIDAGRGSHRRVEARVPRCRRASRRRSSPRPRTPSAPPRAPAGATRDGTAATTSGRSRAAPARRRSRPMLQLPRSLLERQAHDVASGASSDSGPAGGIV